MSLVCKLILHLYSHVSNIDYDFMFWYHLHSDQPLHDRSEYAMDECKWNIKAMGKWISLHVLKLVWQSELEPDRS